MSAALFGGGGGGGTGGGGSGSVAFPHISAYDLVSNSPSCAKVQPTEAEASLQGLSPLLVHPLQALKLPRLTARGERRIRALYCGLIMRAARMLELPPLTGVTATVYWQRFYSRSSLIMHAPGITAAAALFLAAKVEEQSRRVRDVINVVYRCEHTKPYANSQQQQQQQQPQPGLGYASPLHPASASPSRHAPPPSAAVAPPPPPPPVDDGCSLQVSPLFWELKEEVVRFEQHLLRVLAYEVRLVHPQQFVLHFAREIECSAELCRIAYYISNDSARTNLCLQYAPHTIACACIFVGAELLQEQIRFHPQVLQSASEQRAAVTGAPSIKAPSPYRSPHHPGAAGGGSSSASSSSSSSASSVLTVSTHSGEWWEFFGGVSQLQLEDCAHQLLEMYDEQDEQAAAWADGLTMDDGVARTPLQELERIGNDVATELRREQALELAQEQARMQRIEGSLRERTHIASSNSAAAVAAAKSSAMS